MPGSSPLARGPRCFHCVRSFRAGLIPARAGTTSFLAHAFFGVWAHPRSRGDHLPRISGGGGGMGSSPLARGPQEVVFYQEGHAGLIPARAGTTDSGGGIFAGFGAHPRSRGDHGFMRSSRLPQLGSSPLARGPPDAGDQAGGAVGLIPARAGTTLFQVVQGRANRAHPRSRGDHWGELG